MDSVPQEEPQQNPPPDAPEAGEEAPPGSIEEILREAKATMWRTHPGDPAAAPGTGKGPTRATAVPGTGKGPTRATAAPGTGTRAGRKSPPVTVVPAVPELPTLPALPAKRALPALPAEPRVVIGPWNVPEPVAAPSKSGLRLTPAVAAATALGVLVIFLWVRAVHNWFAPVGPPTEPVEAEASLRMAIAITSGRVDDFIRNYRRLPTSLTEIGQQPWDAISLEPVEGLRYRLVAAGPQTPIIYDSMLPREEFLGKSRELLRAGAAGAIH
jgi:hypothetical protein